MSWTDQGSLNRPRGRVFHILAAIDEDERRRWLRCLCEERDL
jgi:head-tail adaptor